MQDDLAIRACGLRRSFGELRAVDGIDLDVPRGMIFAILGPTAPARSRCCGCSPR